MSGRATIAFCCRRARLTSLRAPGSASHVHRTSTASFHCTSSRSPHRSFLLRRTPSPPTFTLPVRSFNSTRIRQLHLPSPATASSIQITDSSPDPHPWSLPSSVQHSHDEIDPNAKESHHALHPALHLTPSLLPLTSFPPPLPCSVHVTFIEPDGTRVPVTGKVGQSLLDLAHANQVELEGACEASLACSTCHVILPQSYYAKLSEAGDEENDMLDMAWGLTDTSRLGCQVKLSEELEGMDVTLPAATRNMQVK